MKASREEDSKPCIVAGMNLSIVLIRSKTCDASYTVGVVRGVVVCCRSVWHGTAAADGTEPASPTVYCKDLKILTVYCKDLKILTVFTVDLTNTVD